MITIIRVKIFKDLSYSARDIVYSSTSTSQILKQEGAASLYRALPPRLLAVVPMIGKYVRYY